MVPRAPDKEILVSETINGSLSVSNDVIADIAGYAAMTCYGVVGMAEQLQGAESVRLLAGQRLRKGVLVSADENGVNMKSVCHNLSSSVAFTLQEIAQIDPASLKIDIHIDALKSRLN